MAELDFKGGRQLYLIGLTGNIACGKSAVLKMMAARGAFTIDADEVVHDLMKPGGTIYGPVVEAFGPTILSSDGQIDRRKLGAIVFADRQQLHRLEEISHPHVRVEITRLISETTARVVVVDAIKLLENNLDEAMDEVWVVTCSPELQIERLMGRNNFSKEEAQLRINAQPHQAVKVARADVVIDNDGSLSQTEQQVEAAWQELAIP